MSRKCFVTGKITTFGNTVSHSNRKGRRSFVANLHNMSFLSATLNEKIALRVSTCGLRTIELKMGIDNYLLGTPNKKLPKKLREFKKRIKTASVSCGNEADIVKTKCGDCGVSCSACNE